MKKITKTFEVYEYSELSKEAKERALNDWNERNDLSILQDILQDMCGEFLREHGIKCTSNYPTVMYSLSNSQGDGAMFEGTFEWKNFNVKIKHQGHYYHSYSKDMDIEDVTGKTFDYESVYREFEAIYQSICKKLEKYGYDWIEDEQSEAHFIDECNANEWTFTKEGLMFN